MGGAIEQSDVKCGTCPYAIHHGTDLLCGHHPYVVHIGLPQLRFPGVSADSHCSAHPFMPKLAERLLSIQIGPEAR